MLIRIRNANRPGSVTTPNDADDPRALCAGSRERAIAVVTREEGLSGHLVAHAIPLLIRPLSDYALFALRKVAEERIGQLTGALSVRGRPSRSGGNWLESSRSVFLNA